MSGFITPLRLEAHPTDDGKWTVLTALLFKSDIVKCVFIVPPGFVTDLASVPRLPFVYMLAGGTSTAAAVVHDYLYSSKEVSRAVADAVLREASAAIGVPAWRRWLMWVGVRVGGASHYGPPDTKKEDPYFG